MSLIDDLSSMLEILRAKHGIAPSSLHVPLNYARFVAHELSIEDVEPTDEITVYHGGQPLVTLVAH